MFASISNERLPNLTILSTERELVKKKLVLLTTLLKYIYVFELIFYLLSLYYFILFWLYEYDFYYNKHFLSRARAFYFRWLDKNVGIWHNSDS